MPRFELDGISVSVSSLEDTQTLAEAGYTETTAKTPNERAGQPEADFLGEPDFLQDLPLTRFLGGYEEDWADEVISKCAAWKPKTVPRWLPAAMRTFEWAFLQLPAPDRRYVAKTWNGISIYNSRSVVARGFRFIKELIETGTITHLIDEQRWMTMEEAGLRSDVFTREMAKEEQDSGNVSGAKIHGLQTQDIDPQTLQRIAKLEKQGKTINPKKLLRKDKEDSSANDFNRYVRAAIDYALKKIDEQDSLLAAELRASIRLDRGIWVFNQNRPWVTSLTEIPYDCSAALMGDTWVVNYDDREPLYVKDCAGMRCFVRMAACGIVPAPAALVAGGDLFSEFLTMPPYHRLFHAMYRRVEVTSGSRFNGEIERAICAEKKLRDGYSYHATDKLTKDSDLHKICGLPTGLVILDADGLTAIQGLVQRKLALMAMDDLRRLLVEAILRELSEGVRFAKMYHSLLGQIEPQCMKAADTVRQAIHRLRQQLRANDDKRFHAFAEYLRYTLETGEVCRHNSTLRWKVEGTPLLPDVVQLAEDHRDYKLRKARKLRSRIEAVVSHLPRKTQQPQKGTVTTKQAPALQPKAGKLDWVSSLKKASAELGFKRSWMTAEDSAQQ
jgi:hypothetical protein